MTFCQEPSTWIPPGIATVRNARKPFPLASFKTPYRSSKAFAIPLIIPPKFVNVIASLGGDRAGKGRLVSFGSLQHEAVSTNQWSRSPALVGSFRSFSTSATFSGISACWYAERANNSLPWPKAASPSCLHSSEAGDSSKIFANR
jgi:hypothetical protein